MVYLPIIIVVTHVVIIMHWCENYSASFQFYIELSLKQLVLKIVSLKKGYWNFEA